MARVTVERIRGRRLEVRSGNASAVVDRSVDEGGEGDGFRSVDLVLAGLGSCTIGTVLAFAEDEGIELGGLRAELRPVAALGSDTVVRAKLELHLDGDLSEEDLARLKKAAEGCKVHQSLHQGIKTELKIVDE